VSLILIDSANREIFSESINLGPDGIEMYEISSDKLSSGAYILSAQRGESIDEARFTVGFTTGSGTITIQTTRNEYLQGEQILILGKTSSVNVLLDVTINDSNGKVIKKFETFSDLSGVFKIDNFRIPMDAKSGIWKIDAKSGSNFKQTEFEVISDSDTMIITLEKDDYNIADTINIEGSGASGSTISLTVMTLNGDKIAELNFAAKSNGQFSTIWQIPLDITPGEYEMQVDDGIRNASIKFIIN
tara:strand:- start:242 stop:976 length:735 start_codon:yes stop_codon:yes gene_type:complete